MSGPEDGLLSLSLCVQVLAKKQAEKGTLDGLTTELDNLRALSRTCHAVLKQFRDECARNETLSSAAR